MIFLLLARPGSHNYVYEGLRWALCRSDKHWLHRTRCCFMLQAAFKSPSQPSQCWAQDTKGSRMLQSLLYFTVGIVPALSETPVPVCSSSLDLFLRAFYLLTLDTMWQTPPSNWLITSCPGCLKHNTTTCKTWHQCEGALSTNDHWTLECFNFTLGWNESLFSFSFPHHQLSRGQAGLTARPEYWLWY